MLTGVPIQTGEDSIYIRNYAGFISTNSIHLNVLPKICEDVAQAERVLFQMLAETGYLPVKKLPLQDFSQTEGILEHFVQLYAVNLYAAVLRTPGSMILPERCIKLKNRWLL